MPELRWTLLIIGVLFVVALAWWERRRPHQASRQAPHISGEPRPVVNDDPSWGPEVSPTSTQRSGREPTLTLPDVEVRGPEMRAGTRNAGLQGAELRESGLHADSRAVRDAEPLDLPIHEMPMREPPLREGVIRETPIRANVPDREPLRPIPVRELPADRTVAPTGSDAGAADDVQFDVHGVSAVRIVSSATNAAPDMPPARDVPAARTVPSARDVPPALDALVTRAVPSPARSVPPPRERDASARDTRDRDTPPPPREAPVRPAPMREVPVVEINDDSMIGLRVDGDRFDDDEDSVAEEEFEDDVSPARDVTPSVELPPPVLNTEKPILNWPPEDQRQLVSLRLVARPPDRFRGTLVRQALAAEGFVLGDLDIFHKPDAENRVVLSCASLTKPGSFDLGTMDTQRFTGLNIFAVLPGPRSPQKAFEDLLLTARMLNERLEGALQDEKGGPLTPTRIQTLRDGLGAEAKS